jgi:maleate isomerase
MKRRHFFTQACLGAAAAPIVHAQARKSQGTSWQRDGAGLVARFGVLTPDFDPVPESEMSAMIPQGVSLHGARVTYQRGDAKAFAEAPNIDQATEQLAALNPRAILFAFTSSSYVLGAEADSQVRARLEQRAKGIPVIFTVSAATEALRLLGAKRISLIHPPWPWFSANSDLGGDYFRAQGFEVVQCSPVAPVRSFIEVAPAEVFEFVSAHTPRTAEAVFIGGNGMRTVEAIRALEARLRKPVLTANQVLLWAALRAVGQAERVTNYGTIFARRGTGR